MTADNALTLEEALRAWDDAYVLYHATRPSQRSAFFYALSDAEIALHTVIVRTRVEIVAALGMQEHTP